MNFPDSQFLIGREISKIHEDIFKFSAKNYSLISHRIKQKGEYSVIIKNTNNINKEASFPAEIKGSSDLSKILSNYLKIDRKKAYNLLLELKEKYTNKV